MDSKRVLILFAHPALQKSRVNRRLVAAIDRRDDVTLHDLYQVYPHFDIDVAAEQQLVESCDVLVFHHPFYWYSVPALLKEWMDLVLEHGWAYGQKGNALSGKWLLSAMTTGGRETAYTREGFNRHTISDLLAPITQTARLCGMACLAPFVVHGTHEMTAEAIGAHAADYRRVIAGLCQGSIDLDAAQNCQRLNANLDAIFIDEDR